MLFVMKTALVRAIIALRISVFVIKENPFLSITIVMQVRSKEFMEYITNYKINLIMIFNFAIFQLNP